MAWPQVGTQYQRLSVLENPLVTDAHEEVDSIGSPIRVEMEDLGPIAHELDVDRVFVSSRV